jgi:4-amino-4-deoxychorismate lyase
MESVSWLNGAPANGISLLDRGLQFGHGCFETIAVIDKKALLLNEHLTRLSEGLAALKIPFSSQQIDHLSTEISAYCNQHSATDFVLKLIVTMGEGHRGYLNPSKPSPNRVLIANPYPSDLKERANKALTIGVSDVILPDQPLLAGIKHCNRLEQILAKNNLSEDVDDALLLNSQGNVIEATSSNLFIVKGKQIITPDLSKQGIDGVIRQKILQDCVNRFGQKAKVMSLNIEDLEASNEVFLTNSIYGVQQVKKINSTEFTQFKVSSALQQECIKNDFVPNP